MVEIQFPASIAIVSNYTLEFSSVVRPRIGAMDFPQGQMCNNSFSKLFRSVRLGFCNKKKKLNSFPFEKYISLLYYPPSIRKIYSNNIFQCSRRRIISRLRRGDVQRSPITIVLTSNFLLAYINYIRISSMNKYKHPFKILLFIYGTSTLARRFKLVTEFLNI